MVVNIRGYDRIRENQPQLINFVGMPKQPTLTGITAKSMDLPNSASFRMIILI